MPEQAASYWKQRLESFPAFAAAFSAATVAAAEFVFPKVLIPSNLPSLDTVGTLLIALCFLVVWAFGDRLRRSRRVFVGAVGLLCFLALVAVAHVLLTAVVDVEIGDPPALERYVIGTELTDRGKAWAEALDDPSLETYVRWIGPDRISDAWGDSFVRMTVQYYVGYLIVAAGMVLMLGVVEMSRGQGDEG